MNYLDFARKIMLYLQIRGILFKFEVNTAADLSCVITKKNGMPFGLEEAEESKIDISATRGDGKPFDLEVEYTTGVDIAAIKGDGIVAAIKSINANGDVDLEFINATAEIAKIEGIEEKTKAIASAVIGQAVSAALAIKDSASVMTMLETGAAKPLIASLIEKDANVAVLVRQINAMLAGVSMDAEANAHFELVLIAATLLGLACAEKSTLAVEAKTRNGIAAAVALNSEANLQAALKLLVEATIELYENYTLEDMGDNTLEDLSTKII